MRQPLLFVASLIALAGPWAACGGGNGGPGATAGNGGTAAGGSGVAGTGGTAGTQATGGAAATGGAGAVGTAGTQATGGIGGAAATGGAGAVGTAGTQATGGIGGAGAGGTAGTQATGGIGGAAAGCGAAVGGATGTPSGGTSGGVLVDCPASPPSGCCSVENLSCAYPTESCVCGSGSWKCYPCPATRPQTDSAVGFLGDLRLWMSCQYGDVTCTYPTPIAANVSSGPLYQRDGWACGVCPASRPTNGAACGNTSFECHYGVDTCFCGGTSGWKCAAPSCETASGVITGGDRACVEPGHFTCRFPALDQNCNCGTRGDARRCTCPAVRPPNGSRCMAYDGHDGALSGCMYGEAKCMCVGSMWNCMDPICPTTMPASGSSCSTQLSCAYGTLLCACNGTAWSCS